MIKRLKVYRGSEHKHQAQKPEKLDIEWKEDILWQQYNITEQEEEKKL
jgi:hypothetical protein